MILLKSSVIFALFMTANSNSIFPGNRIRFPDYKTESETTTTTEIPTEIATTETTTTSTTNLTEKQTENVEASCGSDTGAEYCTDPPGYPEQTILKAVASQQGILNSFFEEDSISTSSAPPRKDCEPDEICPSAFFTSPSKEFEKEPYEEFENICSTTSEHIIPRAARNTRGQFQFIVNQPAGNLSLTQKVQVGECVNPGKECGDGAVFDRKTECHQEFLDHKLVAVSNDGSQMVVDTFRFPSCCTCRFSKIAI